MPGDLEAANPTVVAQLAAILSKIASGEASPRNGLASLVAAYHSAPQADMAAHVGDEYDIALLVGYFYSYDDLEERPDEVSFDGKTGPAARIALDQEVIRLSREWVRARYRVTRSGA